MEMKLSELTQTQIQQVGEYLDFDRSKRNEIRTEISGELSDILSTSIDSELIYTGKDALDLMKNIPTKLEETVNNELERQRDISCILIQHIFHQAQNNNISLELDTPQLDNDDMTGAANILCDQIMAQHNISSPQTPLNVQDEKKDSSKSDQIDEELLAENKRLKEQLSTPLRQWPEFQEAMKKLKYLNLKIHEAQH